MVSVLGPTWLKSYNAQGMVLQSSTYHSLEHREENEGWSISQPHNDALRFAVGFISKMQLVSTFPSLNTHFTWELC